MGASACVGVCGWGLSGEGGWVRSPLGRRARGSVVYCFLGCSQPPATTPASITAKSEARISAAARGIWGGGGRCWAGAHGRTAVEERWRDAACGCPVKGVTSKCLWRTECPGAISGMCHGTSRKP